MPRNPAVSRANASNRLLAQDFKASLSGPAGLNIPITQTAGLPLFSQAGYSVAAWFKPNSMSGVSQYIFAEASTSSNNQLFGLRVVPSTNKVGALIRNNANVIQLNASSNTNILFNTWNHLVWTDNNGTVKLYINGVLDSASFNYTPATPYTLNTSAIGILAQAGNSGNLKGNIAKVRLFNYILSQTDVAAVIDGNLKGNIGHYDLDEGAGSIGYDKSANNNNASTSGNTYVTDTPSKKRGFVGGNLVQNGDFEYAPPFTASTTATNWIDGSAAGSATNSLFTWAAASVAGSVSAMYDNTIFHSGNYSFKMSNLNTSGRIRGEFFPQVSLATVTAANQKYLIPCLPNTSYTLSGWVKTNNAAAASAFIQLTEINGALTSSASTSSNKLTGTNDWTFLTLTAVTNAATRFLAVELKNDVAGNISDAWFDDIFLTPTANTTRAIAT